MRFHRPSMTFHRPSFAFHDLPPLFPSGQASASGFPPGSFGLLLTASDSLPRQPLINFLPRFLLAGLLIYSSAGFLIENLWDARNLYDRTYPHLHPPAPPNPQAQRRTEHTHAGTIASPSARSGPSSSSTSSLASCSPNSVCSSPSSSASSSAHSALPSASRRCCHGLRIPVRCLPMPSDPFRSLPIPSSSALHRRRRSPRPSPATTTRRRLSAPPRKR